MVKEVFESETDKTVRVDRWLWAVRICRTRSQATDLCDRGRILIDGQLAKASRQLRCGQIVVVKKDGIFWHYEVLRTIDKRVGAPLAMECRKDCTPAEDIARVQAIRSQRMPSRPQGMGRPTKKDRRDFEDFMNR